MKLYLNELAPWERKKEYFHHIQLGKDVKNQSEILHNAINNQTLNQLSSASAIIASQERISEGIGNLSSGINDVKEGILGLKSSFEMGISEVVWQLEQNRAVLQNILEVLMAPLDTQAKERKRRAENAYSNGWIDDAEEEFIESEKLNKYDFSIHISLGMIYLFHKVDKKKALQYFDNAVKYAMPKSAYYTSYALLHKALIFHDQGLLKDALKCSKEAVALSPNFSEALYQNAVYCALLNLSSDCIKSIDKAIKLDRKYVLKADTDPLLVPVKSELQNYFQNSLNSNLKYCSETLSKLEETIQTINTIITDIGAVSEFELPIDYFKKEFERIEFLLNRNSLLDSLYARDCIIELFEEKLFGYQHKGNRYREKLIDCTDRIHKSLKEKSDTISDDIEFSGVLGKIFDALKTNNKKTALTEIEKKRATVKGKITDVIRHFEAMIGAITRLSSIEFKNTANEHQSYPYSISLNNHLRHSKSLKKRLLSSGIAITDTFDCTPSMFKFTFGSNVPIEIIRNLTIILLEYNITHICYSERESNRRLYIGSCDESNVGCIPINEFSVDRLINGDMNMDELMSFFR